MPTLDRSPAAVFLAAACLAFGPDGATPAAAASPKIVRLPAAATTEGRPAEIATEIIGKAGPVVVFVSGLGQDRQGWRFVADALAPCARSLIYDRPGLGESVPVPRSPVAAGAAADDLDAILGSSRLPGPYLLVGHSLGGLYVQAFARKHPAETAGVVLVDSMTPEEPRDWFDTATELDGTAPRAEDVGIDASLADLRTAPVFPPVPLVVIAASTYHETPLRRAERLAVQNRTAGFSPLGHMIVAEHSAHFVQTDRPDVVIQAILETLAAAGRPVDACRR